MSRNTRDASNHLANQATIMKNTELGQLISGSKAKIGEFGHIIFQDDNLTNNCVEPLIAAGTHLMNLDGLNRSGPAFKNCIKRLNSKFEKIGSHLETFTLPINSRLTPQKFNNFKLTFNRMKTAFHELANSLYLSQDDKHKDLHITMGNVSLGKILSSAFGIEATIRDKLRPKANSPSSNLLVKTRNALLRMDICSDRYSLEFQKEISTVIRRYQALIESPFLENRGDNGTRIIRDLKSIIATLEQLSKSISSVLSHSPTDVRGRLQPSTLTPINEDPDLPPTSPAPTLDDSDDDEFDPDQPPSYPAPTLDDSDDEEDQQTHYEYASLLEPLPKDRTQNSEDDDVLYEPINRQSMDGPYYALPLTGQDARSTNQVSLLRQEAIEIYEDYKLPVIPPQSPVPQGHDSGIGSSPELMLSGNSNSDRNSSFVVMESEREYTEIEADEESTNNTQTIPTSQNKSSLFSFSRFMRSRSPTPTQLDYRNRSGNNSPSSSSVRENDTTTPQTSPNRPRWRLLKKITSSSSFSSPSRQPSPTARSLDFGSDTASSGNHFKK
jgi:hypothetical protein